MAKDGIELISWYIVQVRTGLAFLMIPVLCYGIAIGASIFDRDSRALLLGVPPLAVFWGWLYARGKKKNQPWNDLTAGFLIAFVMGVLGGAAIPIFGPTRVREVAETVKGAAGY